MKNRFSLLLLILSFVAPNILSAEKYSFPVESSNEGPLPIINWFAKTYPQSEQLIKGVFFIPTHKDVYSVDGGMMIYRYKDGQGLLPSSFGVKDLLIIRHNKNYRSYYSHINIHPLIENAPYGSILGKKQLVGETTPLKILNNKNGFLLSIHNNQGFEQPLNYLSPQYINQNGGYIQKMLLKSGIYQKLLSDKSKKVTLSLRSSFNISILTTEKTSVSNAYQMPKKIELVIKSIQTGETVEKMVVFFNLIINNKLDGKYDAKNIFHHYWQRTFVNLGTWSKKERVHSYTVSAIVTSITNSQSFYEVEVSFR